MRSMDMKLWRRLSGCAQSIGWAATRQPSEGKRLLASSGKRIIAVFLSLMPLAANAVCIWNEPHWLWNYDGNIGDKYRVRMTLVFGTNNVSGVYFYTSQLKDIQLSGRITNGTDIVLDELDAAGKVVARFEGNFLDHDPRGKFPGNELAYEIIVGSWRKLDSNNKLNFFLSLESGTSGTLTNRYYHTGSQDDNLVHQNALRFWNAVKIGDKRTVASLITYPIRVHLAGRTTLIGSPKELLSNYDAVFTPRYRESIAAAIPRNMFVRGEGVMLGDGEVWFDSDGNVIALNNY